MALNSAAYADARASCVATVCGRAPLASTLRLRREPGTDAEGPKEDDGARAGVSVEGHAALLAAADLAAISGAECRHVAAAAPDSADRDGLNGQPHERLSGSSAMLHGVVPASR